MPKRNTSSNTSTAVAWWLSGDQECGHCGRMYFYEVEFRCSDCDGPGCPHCKAVHAEGHLICFDCVPSESTSRKASHG